MLISKRKPLLEIWNKRLVTDLSIFLSEIAKLLNVSKLSTTDCVFIILAIIIEARRKNRTISIAFCDLAKVKQLCLLRVAVYKIQ